MADTKILPVDALARQQLNRRALTAHSNFIVDILEFTRLSNKYNVNKRNDGQNLRRLFTNFQAGCTSWMVDTGTDVVAPSSSCTSRTRPDQHVHMTYSLEAWLRQMTYIGLR